MFDRTQIFSSYGVFFWGGGGCINRTDSPKLLFYGTFCKSVCQLTPCTQTQKPSASKILILIQPFKKTSLQIPHCGFEAGAARWRRSGTVQAELCTCNSLPISKKKKEKATQERLYSVSAIMPFTGLKVP